MDLQLGACEVGEGALGVKVNAEVLVQFEILQSGLYEHMGVPPVTRQ